jgi:uncharacterized repeat protein (TIGR03803 family)
MLRSFDIFRTATFGCGFALAIVGVAHADPAKILYSFQGGDDGALADSVMISDSQGNLYGTTVEGGGSGCYEDLGCGTVFKLAPDGTETVLYAFRGRLDGEVPIGSLVRDKDGNLYGVTGGGHDRLCTGGCGTIFRLAPDGTKTTLYAFKGREDGGVPEAGLLRDERGNLYGTTGAGGAYSRGTVFRIAPDGAESVIYAFCSQANCTDGEWPQSALIADKAGNLYGTTTRGGANSGGTVFRIAPDGTETVLYNFCSVQPACQDGTVPLAGVTMDKAGNLYGTTNVGGAFESFGVVFKLAPDGTETVLHSFWPFTDGVNPITGVIVDKTGNIYGTLPLGNTCKKPGGLVYRLSPDGSEKLHCVAAGLYAGLMERNGYLYSTAADGGKYGDGFVFAIKKH